MLILLRIAFQNLVQARRRSLMLSAAIVIVTMLMVLLASLGRGLTDTLIESATTFAAGHVNVSGFFKPTTTQVAPIIADAGAGFEKGLPNEKAPEVVDVGDLKTRYYIRLRVRDMPGALARIAGIFGKESISLASVRQAEERRKVVDLVFMTHDSVERNLRRAIAGISKLDVVEDVASWIRVEDRI